jgi:hypothetical protein
MLWRQRSQKSLSKLFCFILGRLITVYRLVSPATEFQSINRRFPSGQLPRARFRYERGFGVQSNLVEAFRWTELASKQGMPLAERKLGWMLQNGIGTQVNVFEAATWYHSGAEHNDALSQNNLGWFYQKGLGVQRDPKEALNWYSRAAAQGEPHAEKNLAWMLARGSYGPKTGFGQGAQAQIRSGGFPPDHKRAEELMRKAVDLHSPEGQYDFGSLLLREFDSEGHQDSTRFTEAGKYFTTAAEQGHAKAQYQLASMYHSGQLGNDQRSNCIPWFLKSAAQANPEAEAALGDLSKFYPRSDLLKTVNPVDMLLRSAEKGNLDAQFELAKRYQAADGVAKSETDAFKWMQRAATNQARSTVVSKARYRLGVMYETGYSVPADAAKARACYIDAVYAEFPDPSAAFRVGQMYEAGQDVPQSDDDATQWYYGAFIGAGGEFGSEALDGFFRLYADGRGFPKDNGAPASVSLGTPHRCDVPALLRYINGLVTTPRTQFYVGEIFYRGMIVQRDVVEAAAWLRLSSKQGLTDAQNLLGALDATMSAEQKQAAQKRSADLEQVNRATRS